MAAYSPKYTVAIYTANTSMKYDVTPAITKLTRQESDGEIAQKVTFTLSNSKVNGTHISFLVNVRDRVFIYADDGTTKDEIFRGFIWTIRYDRKKNMELNFTCYDNLIYFQESEEYQYFSAGYSTKSICSTLCSKWGVSLNYNYSSITHPKLPLRGTLSDIFLTDILEEVKKKTGKKFVMRSIKDVVHIDDVASNTTIYKIYRYENGNAIATSSEITMQGMITKVIILGKEDDNERASIETTINGDTTTYGTLQKILNSSGTDLAEVKEEANQLIKEKGSPIQSFSVEAVNIPWIRKGDKVQVVAGDLNGYFIVKGITHYGNDNTMTLEVEKA